MWKRKKKRVATGISEYKGFPVYSSAKARLVPWGDSKPDCMCELLLTELYLYVLEDNFDKTYTEHYVIPVNKISFLGITTSISREKDKAAAVMNTAAAVMGAVTGIYVYDGKSISGKQKVKYYFRIDYQNDRGEMETIYFEDLDSQVEKFVEYWNQK